MRGCRLLFPRRGARHVAKRGAQKLSKNHAIYAKMALIDIFLKHHGLEGYIAFGDSMNDYDMLKCANVSIAMGQGDPRVQEIASFVTKAVDNDGILYAFENCECFKE